MEDKSLLTLGHSNHDLDRFVELARSAGVEVVADVRTVPHSQYTPHFNREPLRRSLTQAGLGYVFLGVELGGRPTGHHFYDETGHVHYDRVAKSELFLAGLARLRNGAAENRVALMCSEGHPAECHRHLLISRVLLEEGFSISHVLPDETTIDAEELLASQRPEPTLFGQEEMTWRSIRLVSPNTALESSSENSEPLESTD